MNHVARKIMRHWVRSPVGQKISRRVVSSFQRHLGQLDLDLAARVSPDRHVLAGPFAGMIYPACQAVGSVLVPKLTGSYEAELHDVVKTCLLRDYSDVVNIGCGEGYYAVGCALRLPNARIHAFDGDRNACAQCASMARANNVTDRVLIRGECTPGELLAIRPSGRTLIICDCEGCEVELLKPSHLPNLSCDLIVEVHEESRGSYVVLNELCRRFADSHVATRISSGKRDYREYPALAGLSRGERFIALDERRRPAMNWLFLDCRGA